LYRLSAFSLFTAFFSKFIIMIRPHRMHAVHNKMTPPYRRGWIFTGRQWNATPTSRGAL